MVTWCFANSPMVWKDEAGGPEKTTTVIQGRQWVLGSDGSRDVVENSHSQSLRNMEKTHLKDNYKC